MTDTPDRKLPIDRPCSACSAGDYDMQHHDHAPPFSEPALPELLESTKDHVMTDEEKDEDVAYCRCPAPKKPNRPYSAVCSICNKEILGTGDARGRVQPDTPDLQENLDSNDRLAEGLVRGVQEMGASQAKLPVHIDGETWDVTVRFRGAQPEPDELTDADKLSRIIQETGEETLINAICQIRKWRAGSSPAPTITVSHGAPPGIADPSGVTGNEGKVREGNRLLPDVKESGASAAEAVVASPASTSLPDSSVASPAVKVCPDCGHSAIHYNLGHDCTANGCTCSPKFPRYETCYNCGDLVTPNRLDPAALWHVCEKCQCPSGASPAVPVATIGHGADPMAGGAIWVKNHNVKFSNEASPAVVTRVCLYGYQWCSGTNRHICEWCIKDLLAKVSELEAQLQQARRDIDADSRDWKQIADELGCEPTREAILKLVRSRRAELERMRAGGKS